MPNKKKRLLLPLRKRPLLMKRKNLRKKPRLMLKNPNPRVNLNQRANLRVNPKVIAKMKKRSQQPRRNPRKPKSQRKKSRRLKSQRRKSRRLKSQRLPSRTPNLLLKKNPRKMIPSPIPIAVMTKNEEYKVSVDIRDRSHE